MKKLSIPNQIKGGSHDTVSMLCANTEELASSIYQEVVARLKLVNDWHTFSDEIKAKFALLDSATNQPTSNLKKGNFVRIDIPGIGSPSGGGFDWTQITDVQSSKSEDEFPFFLFTLKPCPAPDTDEKTVAHFYKSSSSNTFIIRRIGNCIYTEVHGRNETQNTSDVPILDTARNKAVAIGSKMGIGNLNWVGFTNALLKPFK